MAVRAGANEVYKEAASRLVSRLRRLDQVEDLECGIPLNGVVKVLLREFEESAPGGIEEWGWGLTFAGTLVQAA